MESVFLIFYPVIKFYILTFLRKTIFIFLLNKNFFNMKNYLQLLRAIKERGVETSDLIFRMEQATCFVFMS